MEIQSHYAPDGNLQPYVVYALIDPRDQAVRYVGVTNDVYARFKQHIRCDSGNQEKDIWIQDLRDHQLMMVMQSLERVPYEQAFIREQYWINHYLAAGAHLFNRALPLLPGASTRSNTGRRFTNEDIRQIILYRLLTGRWVQEISYDMRSYYEIRYIRKTGKYSKQARSWLREYRTSKECVG